MTPPILQANSVYLPLIRGFVFGLVLLGQTAIAADPKAADTTEDKRFAAVWRLRGDVFAVPASGAERALRNGDPVFVGEKIRAAPSAEAVLRTDDAGMVAVRPGAEFVAERFVARGDAGDGLAMRLITGSLRVITGWIGQTNRSGHKIITASATIGIRGTDHEPFVLTTDLPTTAGAPPHRAGTYDKVNRGGTTLSASGEDLAIDAGRVGFVRAGAKPYKTRALITILLPVLLDKIPDFYVPGEFDTELDAFSQTAEETARKELEKKRKPAVAARCVPKDIAKAWIEQLDQAIVRGDAKTILGLFAPDVAIKARVRSKDGSMSEIELGRDELVESTLATVARLSGYKHRRISIEAAKAGKGDAASCERLTVKSVVIEQGRLSGKPYRFESVENYILELRDGLWLAVKAETTQR